MLSTRCFLTATLVAVAGMTVQAADPVVTVDPSTPESAVLLPVQVLRANDYKTTYDALPADQKAAYEAKWKAQNDTANPKDDAQLDATLAKLLAPDAVDSLTKEYSPKLANPELAPAKLSQNLMTFSAILPMMAGAGQPGQPGQPPAAGGPMAALIPKLQGLLQDAAAWVPTAGINDTTHLHDAITHIVAGTKALGFTSAKQMRALSLDDFLGHLGPATKEFKLAIATYNAPVDTFLDGVTAKAEPGDGDHRILDVGFSLFGKPYSAPVKVDKADGHWEISPDNKESLGGLGMLGGMVGAGGMGGGRPGGPPSSP
jgi:hypothetical protein